MCTWQRLVDYQPPRPTIDAGWMVFNTAEQVLEIGIHGVYSEVWDRLPGSTGRRIAVAEPARADGKPSARIFVAGDYLMRVRPDQPLSPAFEISFGKFAHRRFSVEASTQPALRGSSIALSLARNSEGLCEVRMEAEHAQWKILEWVEA
jgi:hypothetical protein